MEIKQCSQIGETKDLRIQKTVIKIRDILSKEGYIMADSFGFKIVLSGVRIDPLDEYYFNKYFDTINTPIQERVLGILEPRGTFEEKCMFGLIKNVYHNDPYFLGKLHLGKTYDSDFEKKWILTIFREENMPKMKGLMKKISEPFNIPIEILLDRSNNIRKDEEGKEIGVMYGSREYNIMTTL